MKLSDKKVQQLKKMPLIQTRIRRVRDTNLIIHQTTITDVRPIEYYEAVVDKTNAKMETQLDENGAEEIIL